ncbi:MAG: hypothetical protein AAF497_00715 [Planctomycetota bacterium]
MNFRSITWADVTLGPTGLVELAPDQANQRVSIFATSENCATVPDVSGLNLRIQIGDGGSALNGSDKGSPLFNASTPGITAIEIQPDSSIWGTNHSTSGFVEPDTLDYLLGIIDVVLDSGSVPADGELATLVFDTTGLSPQSTVEIPFAFEILGANESTDFAGTPICGEFSGQLFVLGATATGDFNGDSNFDCADIDALVAAIVDGNNDSAAFDITGDGFVDSSDLDQWLVLAGQANLPSGAAFLPGDANLDGVVDVSDFNVWNTNKFNQVPAWCSGDFNADGVVDVSDFNIWNTRKFQSSGDASAVPEPDSWFIFVIAIGMLWPRR